METCGVFCYNKIIMKQGPPERPKINEIFSQIEWNSGQSKIPEEVSDSLKILCETGIVTRWSTDHRFKIPENFMVDGVFVKFDSTLPLEIGDKSQRKAFFQLAQPFSKKKLLEAVKAYKKLENFASPDNKEEPVMSFELFTYPTGSARGIGRNNFYFRFSVSPTDMYANKEYVIRFRKEHPEKYKSICDKLYSKKEGSLEELFDESYLAHKKQLQEELDREVYEAYKIMRGYGFSDHDLCG